MSREIKFRAWHGKGFFTDFQISSDGNYIYECGDRYNRDEVELSQYTGLKDKNGVEIYEWDILKYKYSYSNELINPVIYNRDCFEVDDGSKIGFLPVSWLLDHADYCEVIGNIYENENLIKGK